MFQLEETSSESSVDRSMMKEVISKFNDTTQNNFHTLFWNFATQNKRQNYPHFTEQKFHE